MERAEKEERREKLTAAPERIFSPLLGPRGKEDTGKELSVTSADVRGKPCSCTELAIHAERKGDWCPLSRAATPIPAAIRR